MSHNLFMFEKGYQERLCEFKGVLKSYLRASQIQTEWSNYLEFTLEPVGWQAMCKLSRDLCTDMKIFYPCTVIVLVEQVNFKDLSCLVSIIEVEDNITHRLPEKMVDMPLINLYPTIEQDNAVALSMLETAQLIDSLRFFYNNLWMPWDLECDDDSFWVESHLEGRLQLYFITIEGKIPYEVSHEIARLVEDARRIQLEIGEVETAMEEEMSVEEFGRAKMLHLTELHYTLCDIGNQYTLYEKPQLLKAKIEKVQTQKKIPPELSCKVPVIMVMSTATPLQLNKLAELAEHLNKKSIRFLQSLEETLVKAEAGSEVWLSQGRHPVRHLGCLEAGGKMSGVEPGVVVTDQTESSTRLSLVSGHLELSNLTLHITTSWDMLKVQPEAECVLSGVSVEGWSWTDGVYVYPGGTLRASDCHFSNCRTAVVCSSNSSVILSNCTFTDNNISLELREGCTFTMENCTISGSKLYGVHILTPRAVPSDKPSIEYMNSLPHMKQSGTQCKNNAVDINLHPITVLQPFPLSNSSQNGQCETIPEENEQ